MRVLLQCRGVESQGPIDVTVPDGTGTVTLRSLIESQFEYAPPIVSAVQEAAANASASERAAIEAQVRSEAAADRADAKVDDAINNGAELVRNEVKQDADRAVSARQAATQSESNAAASEDAAASSASSAATSETNAKQSEDNAGDYAAVATTAATEAVDAMESASNTATSIVDSVNTAAGHADRAEQSESGAAAYAQNASDAADRVGTAEQVGTWAQQAQDAADRIGTAETVEGWANSSRDSASAAEQSASKSKEYRDAALNAASSTADELRGDLINIAGEASNHATESSRSAARAKTSETNSKTHEVNASSAADRAEFAAEETIQQVEGDFATRNYVDGKAWQRGLLYTTSLDEVLTPGVYSQPNTNWATLDNGYPEQTRGTLTVSSWDTADPGRVYQVFTATYYNRVWMRERVNGTWAKWVNFLSGSFQVNGDLNYQDLNNVLSPGVYRQPLSARATVARNYPQATRGILTVHQWGDESQVSQTYQATFRGDVYTREHSATGWEEWIRIGGDTSTSGNGSQLNHRRDAMKQASRMRRGGVIGTNGATPVSLSFDHGYVNFRDKVLPHLRRLGLPSTSAFNQGQLGSGENEGISWPQLQEFGLNYGVEFAHHGYSHTDISDASTNVERITNALTSSIDLVKTNMPEVVADAFILPGVGGTNYDGFNGGADPESWWTHPAGRALMQHFPVVSAKRRGVAVPLMQGEDLSFGSDRLGWDTADGADTLKSHIQSLAGTTMGVKCFMHPSQIGLAGKISEAKLVETLEWLAAERDAGRVEVLTVSGFAYADVTSNARMNIAPSWTGDQAVISLSPMMDYLAGAQVLVETTADTSGTLTISATSDTGGLDATVTHTATAGRRYRLAFSIPKSAKTITITAPGNLRSARIV